MCTISLWQEFKNYSDPSVRERLILQYAPLVKYVVGRMAVGLPTVLDSEDIISHATIGLIDAIERFDPERGLKFETYAIPRIRGSVIDAVRRLGIYPRGARRKAREIDAAIAALEETKGRTPNDEEVAEYLGITPETYAKELMDISISIVPLERTVQDGDDEALPLSDIIADAQSPCPVKAAERAELRETLIQAINELPDRDRLLLALYYKEELTLKEISHVLEVSESRVCQLHSRIVLRLRRALANVGLTESA
jgi:RNA polymerase sigma factor for flagellar operon FliA